MILKKLSILRYITIPRFIHKLKILFKLYTTFNYKVYFKKNEKNKFQDEKNEIDEIFILGSSKSILHLSEKQKNYINKSKSVGMNRYLLFWEDVGIWPQYFFFHDFKFSFLETKFHDLIQKLLNTNKPYPIFIGPKTFRFSMPRWYKSIFYKSFLNRNKNFAENLNQEIFFYHGSLTALLNIIIIKKLAKKIILVGNTLNTNGYFFEESYTKKYGFLPDYDEFNRPHSTYVKINDVNILTNFNIIKKKLIENGIKLYCVEKESEFYRKNFCELYNFKEI